MRNFTPEEIDAMPNLARMDVRIKLEPAREGDPVFYYDSNGDMWTVINTEVGYAKELL